jgi:hypothetical protein
LLWELRSRTAPLPSFKRTLIKSEARSTLR